MSHGRLTPSPVREDGAPRRATWEEAPDHAAESLLRDVATSPTIETTRPVAGTAEFKAAAVRVGKLIRTG